MGCAKEVFIIGSTFLDWIHPILGFYCILGITCLVDDSVHYISVFIYAHGDLSSSIYSIIYLTWLKTQSIGI